MNTQNWKINKTIGFNKSILSTKLSSKEVDTAVQYTVHNAHRGSLFHMEFGLGMYILRWKNFNILYILEDANETLHLVALREDSSPPPPSNKFKFALKLSRKLLASWLVKHAIDWVKDNMPDLRIQEHSRDETSIQLAGVPNKEIGTLPLTISFGGGKTSTFLKLVVFGPHVLNNAPKAHLLKKKNTVYAPHVVRLPVSAVGSGLMRYRPVGNSRVSRLGLASTILLRPTHGRRDRNACVQEKLLNNINHYSLSRKLEQKSEHKRLHFDGMFDKFFFSFNTECSGSTPREKMRIPFKRATRIDNSMEFWMKAQSINCRDPLIDQKLLNKTRKSYKRCVSTFNRKKAYVTFGYLGKSHSLAGVHTSYELVSKSQSPDCMRHLYELD